MTRILIVEDTSSLREELELVLQLQGYEVEAAANGQQGLDRALESPPDLIVSDVMMPVMDGFEMAERLQDDSRTSGIPFLYLTARATREDMRKGMTLGADDYLTKPFTSEEFLAAIEAVVRRRERIKKRFDARTSQQRDATDELTVALGGRRPTDEFGVDGVGGRDELAARLQELDASTDQGVSFLSIEIDRLERLAATLGKEAQEDVLETTARRLRQALPASSGLYLVGTATLAAVLPTTEQATVRAVALKAVEAARTPQNVAHRELRVTLSIGVALGGAGNLIRTGAELLGQARTAMVEARETGRNHVEFHDPALLEEQVDRLELSSSLHRALERRELSLHYQPKVNLQTGVLRGVEALARWESPTLGRVSPGQFIPVAEESGLIGDLGIWVLDEAARQTRQWLDAGHRVRCAVNMSPRQWDPRDIEGIVGSALDRHELPADLLILELTETALLLDPQPMIVSLEKLRDRGVSIALDDFGTGFSNLENLGRFPLDELKVDQAFIRGLPEDPVGGAVTVASVQLGHSLGLEIVAEGVETPEQLEWLRRCGCDTVQGYYLARPQPAEAIDELLAGGALFPAASRS